jgi:hypothetical protein
MPDLNVVGGFGYRPTPNQIQRVTRFVSWLPTQSKPQSVIIVPDKDFSQISKSGSVFAAGNRVYISDSLFNQSNGVETAIAGAYVPNTPKKTEAVNSIMQTWKVQNQPSVKPDRITVSGGGGYTPSAEQRQSIQNFMHWLPAGKKPNAVVILPPSEFAKLAQQESPRHRTEAAFTVQGRTYLNADVFNDKNNPTKASKGNAAQYPEGQAVEWTLAHETGHLNSTLTPEAQEEHDSLFDDFANNRLKSWNDPQGQAYRALQQNAESAQVQPTDSQMSGTLQPPAASKIVVEPKTGGYLVTTHRDGEEPEESVHQNLGSVSTHINNNMEPKGTPNGNQ